MTDNETTRTANSSDGKASFTLASHNPDVLTCIANLSNDEVFTPPSFANEMLDTVARAWAEEHGGKSLWSDPDVTFLDPFTKSGVFLREIAQRLTDGLAQVIPNLQERVDHILTKQIFGIGITQLTAFLARRSVYCSKNATGRHSIVKEFGRDWGNVWFERTEHTWGNRKKKKNAYPLSKADKFVERAGTGKCIFCGASEAEYARDDTLESHAYEFIHTDDIKSRLAEIFGENVKFDVIIGNPPYQLSDGGQGASAVPIYDRFVTQAKALNPRFLCMIIPARWYFGGRGLNSFRESMLVDRRIQILEDYPDSRDAFDSVDVAGGVCFFLWNRQYEGDCTVITKDGSGIVEQDVRPLMEPGSNVFVRDSRALAIVKKILSVEGVRHSMQLPEEKRFQRQVSGQKPFGLRTYYRGKLQRSQSVDVLVKQAGGEAWMKRTEIHEGVELIDKWKVFTSKSSSEHAGQVDKHGQRRVLSLSGVLPPGSVVTETYVLLGVFNSESEARNCYSYVITRFFRFLIAARTSAQDLPRSAYTFIPIQDFSRPWDDADLYAKYGLSADEVAFIESKIRPMELSDDA